MKFASAFVAAALTIGALAVPAAEDFSGRAARRQAARAARRAGVLKISEGEAQAAAATNESNVSYSSNWSGAVLTAPPSGTTFKTVVGTFTVPTPSVPSGGSTSKSSSYSASAWVGIDGDTYTKAILQAGVDFTVSGSGTVSYDSWYEWYPDYAYDFSGFSVSAGDSITITITATTTTTGTVTLKNNTTGKSVSKTLSEPTSTSPLGGQNAEWIVEDYEEGSSLVSLANFGTVVFTGASATTASGTSVGLTGAEVIDIEQSSKVLTSVTINSASEVTIKYV